jgi:hypothetical protein
MNEGDEAIESMVTRKKKRRSGFRYSSKKVLEALSYPSEIGDIVHHDCSVRSGFPLCLDSVEELDGDGVELNYGNAITYDGCNIKVNNINFPDTCLIHGLVIVNSY